MQNFIHQYGWLRYKERLPNSLNEQQIGRILTVHKTNYSIMTQNGPLMGQLTGQLLYSADLEERPQTGDWVQIMPYETQCIITGILPRYNQLARKVAGKKSDKQLFATNIDKALLVQGLDRDFNLRRLERIVVAIRDANIQPIIILNKSDLSNTIEVQVNQVKTLFPDLKVIHLSALSGDGITYLEEVLQCHETLILIGSSGAGKSTLLNAVMSAKTQETAQISAAVGKGIHTTTRRELFALPNGSLLIDTAGIREFGITLGNPDAIITAFADIDQLAKACYYSDCTHTDEPNCAVLKAIDEQQLDEGAYHSFLKLRDEAKHYAASQQEKKRKGKDISKLVRNMKRSNIKKRY